MTPVREAFLEAASSATGLLGNPAVAARWGEPSALTGFSVGGLAVHLSSQVLNAERSLRHEVPADVPRIPLVEHYVRSPWVEAAIDHEVNLGIVEGGEAEAIQGPAALVEQTTAALQRLRHHLPAEPDDRYAMMPWWGWAMTLDDTLTTRLMEMAVHSDDLAVSVEVPTPALTAEVMDPVLGLLAELSRRRHGSVALLRAYSRSERAPATISAF